MEMKKSNYVIEPDGLVYRLKLPRTGKEVRMVFNDWINFLDKTFHKKEDFALYHCFTGLNGYLMLYQSISGVIETTCPHTLRVYADNVTQALMLRLLEKYQPQYGEKNIIKAY